MTTKIHGNFSENFCYEMKDMYCSVLCYDTCKIVHYGETCYLHLQCTKNVPSEHLLTKYD